MSPIGAEGVARALRHEVGDLLQSLYSTVALVQGRLPDAMELEKRLLKTLRGRAELCRLTLDATLDLVCPPSLTCGPVDLAALTGELARSTTLQRSVRIETSVNGPAVVHGDLERLRSAGKLLLENAVASASTRVQMQVTRLAEGAVAWSVRDDGPALANEQLTWLKAPFAQTRRCLTGLSLALARQVAEAHGGSLQVGAPPEGGAEVSMHLPVRADV
jgi:signal transduction histidine kinase